MCIRGKFLGKGKRDSVLSKGKWILVGLREWENNNIIGQGTFNWANRDKYIGEFLSGNMHGQGTYFFVNGNKHVGSYVKGKYNGYGTLILKSENIFDASLGFGIPTLS